MTQEDFAKNIERRYWMPGIYTDAPNKGRRFYSKRVFITG